MFIVIMNEIHLFGIVSKTHLLVDSPPDLKAICITNLLIHP